jgi:hypothetical protein
MTRLCAWLVVVVGCASSSPRQAANLGVFNPNGLESRFSQRFSIEHQLRKLQQVRPQSRALTATRPLPCKLGEVAEQ